MQFKDRIIGFQKVPSSQLQAHPQNFRLHSVEQIGALEDVFSVVGVAGAAVAYHSERYGGLTLIDGHLRREILEEVPVLVLDVNDAEADLILAAYDRVGSLAKEDPGMFKELTKSIEVSLQDADHLKRMLEIKFEIPSVDLGLEEDKPVYPLVADVDEGYDMVMIFCTREFQFAHLSSLLELPQVRELSQKAVGTTRVISYQFFMEWYASRMKPKEPKAPSESFTLEIPEPGTA